MRYLTIEQRESLQAQLRARIAALHDAIGEALRRKSRTDAIGFANHLEEIDDEPVADLETTLEVAQVEREERELQDAQAALARLHTPDYGVCTECGEDIPFSRLSANPLTARCAKCEARFERAQPEPHSL